MAAIILAASNTDANGISTPVNWREFNFKIGFGVVITNTPTYSVQITFDDPEAPYSTSWNVNATWFNHDTVVSETTNQYGSILFPVRGVKIIVSSGTGTATATFLQAT